MCCLVKLLAEPSMLFNSEVNLILQLGDKASFMWRESARRPVNHTFAVRSLLSSQDCVMDRVVSPKPTPLASGRN